MKTFHRNVFCKHCKTEMGIAVTTVHTRRSKMVAYLYCDLCSFPNQVFWDTNPAPEDPDQLNLFNEEKKEGWLPPPLESSSRWNRRVSFWKSCQGVKVQTRSLARTFFRHEKPWKHCRRAKQNLDTSRQEAHNSFKGWGRLRSPLLNLWKKKK